VTVEKSQLPKTTTKINGKARDEFRALKTHSSIPVLQEHYLSLANHELISLSQARVAVSQITPHEATAQ